MRIGHFVQVLEIVPDETPGLFTRKEEIETPRAGPDRVAGPQVEAIRESQRTVAASKS